MPRTWGRRSLARTAVALDGYRAGGADREAALLRVETEEEFDGWEREREKALGVVRRAFHDDTGDINGWDKIRDLSDRALIDLVSSWRRAKAAESGPPAEMPTESGMQL